VYDGSVKQVMVVGQCGNGALSLVLGM
jgi:hypothetical protein